jgi:hypothetical protein
MFQSLMVLESFTLKEYAPEHDHLDDLESFVYVLAYLFWTFEKAGVVTSSPPEWLTKWGHVDPEEAYIAKKCVMFERRLHGKYMRRISDYWGAPCRILLSQLHQIVFDVASKKSGIANDAADGTEVPDYTHLRYNKDGTHKYYNEFIRLLDDAIEGVRAETLAKVADYAEGCIEERLVASPPAVASEGPVASNYSEREVPRE